MNGHQWEIITSPPPSSGGVATIEALNILQTVPLKSWDDPESVHWVIEAMRRAFADRAMYLADPDFARVPVAPLISGCYADSLRATIDPAKASVEPDRSAWMIRRFSEAIDFRHAQNPAGRLHLVADKDAAAIRTCGSRARGPNHSFLGRGRRRKRRLKHLHSECLLRVRRDFPTMAFS